MDPFWTNSEWARRDYQADRGVQLNAPTKTKEQARCLFHRSLFWMGDAGCLCYTLGCIPKASLGWHPEEAKKGR